MPNDAVSAASWRPADMNVQVADLLPECVAVQAKHVRSLELVATSRRQRPRDQGPLHLADQTVVDARRRQGTIVGPEITVDMPLDGVAEAIVRGRGVRGQRRGARVLKLQRDHVL